MLALISQIPPEVQEWLDEFLGGIFGDLFGWIESFWWIPILIVSLIAGIGLIIWIFIYIDAKKKHIGGIGLFFFGWLLTGIFGAILYYLIASKMQITRKMVKSELTGKKDKPEWQSTCVVPKNKNL